MTEIILLSIFSSLTISIGITIAYREEIKIRKHYRREENERYKETGKRVKL